MGTARTYEPGTPSWVDLETPDVDGAVAFYRGLFGWATDGDRDNYRMFRLGGADVAGVGPAIGRGPATRAVELGGSVAVQPFDIPHVGRLAVLADPYGATFTVMTRAHEH